ncbi:MAG: hypothetical protein JW934_24350 [Anaerolineae bacterium]|nr:hypothetical protein [Anaerolineae bacterium]
MANDNWDEPLSAFSKAARVIPRADFVRKLGSEIGRAARDRVGYGVGRTFEDRVLELRRLVRLLREALVPVQPRLVYRRALGEQLRVDALRVTVQRQTHLRWLVIGSVIGSVLSLAGLLAAMLFRQRRVPPRNRTVGAT